MEHHHTDPVGHEDAEVETTHRRVVSPAAGSTSVEQVDVVATDPYDERRAIADKMVQAIYFVFGVVEVLIALRFVLKLLGANPNAGFSSFIYSVTWPLVAPFAGMFDTPAANGSVVEWHSLIAMVVYALLAWLLARLVWLVLDDPRTGVRARTRNIDTHVR